MQNIKVIYDIYYYYSLSKMNSKDIGNAYIGIYYEGNNSNALK